MDLRFFLACGLVSLSSFSFALYNGSPALPEMPENGFFLSKDSAIALKTGYEGDFILGRNLEISSPSSDPGIRGMFNAATLTFGFVNRIEVYTSLGSSEYRLFFHAQDEEIKLKAGGSFGGEIGIRANTPVWADMKFGVDAKYFYAWPNLSEVSAGGQTLSTEGKVFEKEWQVGAGFSQTFAFFTPYVGVRFSKFSLKFVNVFGIEDWVPSRRVAVHNQNPFGLFIGMGIAAPRGVYFDFEARFIDEYALTGAFGLSF